MSVDMINSNPPTDSYFTPNRKMNALVDPPLLRAQKSRIATFSNVGLPMDSVSLPFLTETQSMEGRAIPLRPRLMNIQSRRLVINNLKSDSINQNASPSCPRIRPRSDRNEILEPPTAKRTVRVSLKLDENFEFISDPDSTGILSNDDRSFGSMRRRNSDQALAA